MVLLQPQWANQQVNYINGINNMMRNGNVCLKLIEKFDTYPHKVAVHTSDKNITYSQYKKVIVQTVNILKQNGVHKDDMIAVSFSDEFSLLSTLIALACIGATSSVIQKNTPQNEYLELQKQLKFTKHITDDESKIETPSHILINQILLFSNNDNTDLVIEEKISVPFMINNGSGTTGKPKMIPISHQQLYARLLIIHEMDNITEDDCLGSVMIMEFSSTQFRALAALLKGASVVIGIQNPILLTQKYNVSNIATTAFHMEMLLKDLPNTSKDLFHSLKSLSIGFSTISDTLRKRIKNAICETLYIGYGSNECGSITRAIPPYVYDVPDTVGHSLKGVSIEVVNTQDQILPANEIGLIRVKSPGLISGYFNNETATEKAFKNGWFYPGDLGKLTQDGQLIHMGRSDDMMIMNGVNIYPSEIEHAILKHSAVKDAAAVPIESTIHGHIPVCAVVLYKNQSLSENELLDFVTKRLGTRSPKMIFFFNDIPKTEMGKTIKQKLMDEVQTRYLLSINQPYIQQQNAIKFKIMFDAHAKFDISMTDKWLYHAMKIELLPSKCSICHEKDKQNAVIIEMTWRVLLIIRALLQAVYVPAFDTGDIIQIDLDNKDTPKYIVTIAVARIDNIPFKIYQKVIDTALGVIKTFATKAYTTQAQQELYSYFESNILKPLHNLSGSGKSTIPTLNVAYNKNIPFYHLGQGMYQLGWGRHSKRMSRSMVQSDSFIGAKIAQNKISASSMVRAAGLPAPVHIVVRLKDDLTNAVEKLGWPLVAKPVDRDRGEGVTVGLKDMNQLQLAFEFAYKASIVKQVIIEKEVSGICCRLFIANNKLLYAVKRLPKSVKGDGQHSVAELIAIANAYEKNLPPWKKTEIFPLDELAIKSINNAGFTLESIPEQSILVPLRDIESTQWGGVDEDVTHVVHPENLEIALKAAKLFGLDVAGIDIISSDISLPWYQNGAIINEVNFSPLFGGGEISKNSIPSFFDDFINGEGRIPIKAYIGDKQALEYAKEAQSNSYQSGVQSYITTDLLTIKPNGQTMHYTVSTLYQRCYALILDTDVDEILLVLPSIKNLKTELPVDSIEIVYNQNDA